MTFKRFITLCTIACSGFSQMSCSDSKSQKVGVSFIPDRPVVINADIKILDVTTIDPTDTTDINAPWFRSEMSVSNGADTTVTIVGFNAEAVAADGRKQKYSSKLPADEYFITELAPGGVFRDVGTYFDDLPVTNGNTNFRYRVSVTVIGWFGTATDPQERFEKTVTFSTN